MYGRILKSLNIVTFYRGMSKLKLKINVKVPQLLCIVVSVALNGEFERFALTVAMLGKSCRNHSPAARAFYISLVFSNACRVLSQCKTRLRLLYLLNNSFLLLVDSYKRSPVSTI